MLAVTSAEAASRQGGLVWWTRSPAQLLSVLGAGAETGSWCPVLLHRLMPDLKAVGTVCFTGWPTQELHVLVPPPATCFVTAVLRGGLFAPESCGSIPSACLEIMPG